MYKPLTRAWKYETIRCTFVVHTYLTTYTKNVKLKISNEGQKY